LVTRLWGPQSRSVSCGEKKNVCSCSEAQAVYCYNIGLDVTVHILTWMSQFISWPGCHSFVSWPECHSSCLGLDVTVYILTWMSQFISWPGCHSFISWPGCHSFISWPGCHSFVSWPGCHSFVSWPECHSSCLGLDVTVPLLARMSQFLSWPGCHSSSLDPDVTVPLLAWMSQFLSWPGCHSSLTHFASSHRTTGSVDFVHRPEFYMTRNHDVSETGPVSILR
jgi:hypothetical protein